MADRPCNCLRPPKSPMCSCQHCQWFCAGWDAIAIRQAWITWLKHHLPNAYEILVTRYDQFRTGVGHFWRIFDREGASTTIQCWCQKTTAIAISCGIKKKRSASFSFVTIHASHGRTDRQNCDSNTVHCITCSHTVKTGSINHCHGLSRHKALL